MFVKTKDVREQIKKLDQIIEQYNLTIPKKERDWKTYEQQYNQRLKTAILFFQPHIKEAVNRLHISEKPNVGRPPKLNLNQKVQILLIQRLIEKSNREMSLLLLLFSCLNDIDISYKTVERIYDDEMVKLVLINLHFILLEYSNIKKSDVCGDGTGYVLSVKEHYASSAQKLKENGKMTTKKRKVFFTFTLMDIEKRLYVAYGTSFKSEKEAYNQAIKMLKSINIDLKSIRLDRYYSGQGTVKLFTELFGGIKCYLIPKKNATIKGTYDWKRMLEQFVNNTYDYLSEYFKRNQSESGFSEDKRRFGWRIPQKLPHRADTSYFGIITWHNLLWAG